MGTDIHPYLEYAKVRRLTARGLDRQDEERDAERPLHWYNLTGRIDLDRDYLLFSYLADVRNFYGDGSVESIMPKGMPDDLSSAVADEYYYWVDDALAGVNDWRTRYISMERALEYAGKKGKDSGRWDPKHGPDSERPRIAQPDWHSPSWLSLDELKLVRERYINTPVEDTILERYADPQEALERDIALSQQGYTRDEFISPNILDPITLQVKSSGVRKDDQPPVYAVWRSKLLDTRPAPPVLDAVIAMMESLEREGAHRTRLILWFDN